MLTKARPFLKFSNVVAILALFLAVGGGAFAVAKGVRKSKKIPGTKIKPNSLPGDRLTDNSVGAGKLSGPQLVAYALVNADGSVNGAHSAGITAGDISKTGLSSYCFKGLPAFKTADATPAWESNANSPTRSAEVGYPDGPNGGLVQTDCGPGVQVEVVTLSQTATGPSDGSGFSRHPFTISLYR